MTAPGQQGAVSPADPLKFPVTAGPRWFKPEEFVCCLLLLMESKFNPQESAFTCKIAGTPLGNPEFMTYEALLRGGDRRPALGHMRDHQRANEPTKAKHPVCYSNQ